MTDWFERTRQSYQHPEGAKAFVAKEMPHLDGRNSNVFQLLDFADIKGKQAIDMGCGFGRDVAEMRRRGAEAWGVDVSADLLKDAEARYGGGGWIEGDLLTYEQPPSGQVDLVWSLASLVHTPRVDMPKILTRWHGWLREGGHLILLSKTGEGERVVYNLGEKLPRMMVYYTVQEILDVLVPLGMTVEMASSAWAKGAAVGDDLFAIILKKG
ncbi:MAG: hypothetical protein COY40_04450 [Alphaproteobacteria bacterium CG_4_10_14_0_8_um_filter_53_9]|nr:MAG: hypothetical protein COY40_04450 [Alphaproteobacteria bacterium CG_4_10_14_0_8_um_filter_53_9]